MDKLKKKVALAHRRLLIQHFITVLPWCLFATLLVAAIALAVPKFYTLALDPSVWTWSWLGGALGVGLLAAAIWTYAKRTDPLNAAIEIDLRFQLKERVSSTLALQESDLETEAGRALMQDALRRVGSIDVNDRFGVSLGRRAWLPLVPAVLAFCLVMFFQDKGLDNPAEANIPEETKKQIKKSTEVLRRRMAERRKKAKEKGLKDAEGLFKKLEDGTRKLGEKKDVDRKKAMVKLNDLARELEKRRKSLGSGDKLKQQLDKLKKISRGPADKMAKAMRDGDFNKAMGEMKKLQEQLRNGKLDDAGKQQLAKQMDEMKNKLQQMADAHNQAKKDLKKQIEKAQQAGDHQQADKLQQQLDKLQQQSPKMDNLQDMASKLGKAAQDLKQGNAQDAAKALDQIAQNLDQMQQEIDEMQMIDDAMDMIADAKDSMGCKKCGGAGCKACQGQGQGGAGDKFQDGPPGDGLGPGRGQGDRPEEKDDTKSYDSRVRQNVRQGRAVITDFVQGPNIKGQVREGIKAEIENARREAADPLTGRRLPRSHREHAKQYFDTFREGE